MVQTDRPYVFELEPNYHFIYLLLHIGKHMTGSGAGARMYLDLAFMIKNEPRLDFGFITDTCERLGVLKFLNSTLYLLDKWFGIKPEIDIPKQDEDIISLMEEYIISAGVFGYYKRNSAVARLRNGNKGVSKVAALRRYIFPSYSSMREQYHFLNGRPYLLPSVWVIRLFDGIFLRRKKATSIFKGILTKSEEAAISDKMLKGIGLDIKLK